MGRHFQAVAYIWVRRTCKLSFEKVRLLIEWGFYTRLYDRFTTEGRVRTDSGWSWTFRIARVTLHESEVAPWRHKYSHLPFFTLSVWPSSHSNFNLKPSPLDSTEKNYQIYLYLFFFLENFFSKLLLPFPSLWWLSLKHLQWSAKVATGRFRCVGVCVCVCVCERERERERERESPPRHSEVQPHFSLTYR